MKAKYWPHVIGWVPGRNALLKTLLIICLGITAFVFSRYFIEELLFEWLFSFSNYYRDAIIPLNPSPLIAF